MEIFKKLFAAFMILGLSFSFSAQSFAQSFLGMEYDFIVTNPAGVAAALDKYMASPTGRNNPGYPILNQYVVNGENPSTHNIVTIFSSVEDMDKSNAANAVSQDWATFLTELADVASPAGELLYLAPGISVGDQSIIASPNYVSQWLMMEVTDSEKYVDAWMELAEEYQSDKVLSQLITISADGDRGATHNLIISARNMTDLLTDPLNTSSGFSRFNSKVANIRTVISRNIVTQVKNYAPAM